MRKLIISFALLLATGVGPAVATAAELTFALDQIFNPILIPDVAPQAVVTLTDVGDAVRVDVTNISSGNLDSLYFNFNGDPYGSDPRDLRFSNVTLDGADLNMSEFRTRLARNENQRRGNLLAPGGGFYDGAFDFRRGSSLDSGETLSFDLAINGVDLSISDFVGTSLSDGTGPTFVFASRIFGQEGGSVWAGGMTPAPIPASFLLFGSSLIGLIAISRMNLFA
ncbi:MAG: hypothetical protein MPW17_04710 [Candidatus Manganitrophus sp.]|nr:hypothetical protein [Candidatus Manganitrophus sp.]MDC4226697.1 hypothetical protein [Candidatus Manganitrophus sp.]WDT72144.1 MAG: hypothetical protein MPW17_04710 [Candidatus Manganitrophus sp.]